MTPNKIEALSMCLRAFYISSVKRLFIAFVFLKILICFSLFDNFRSSLLNLNRNPLSIICNSNIFFHFKVYLFTTITAFL